MYIIIINMLCFVRINTYTIALFSTFHVSGFWPHGTRPEANQCARIIWPPSGPCFWAKLAHASEPKQTGCESFTRHVHTPVCTQRDRVSKNTDNFTTDALTMNVMHNAQFQCSNFKSCMSRWLTGQKFSVSGPILMHQIHMSVHGNYN